ncbi:MAG: GNAT family N-acetyltransferase [Bdellovibrionaceae bacterium]|nr:GNAT family N-acetyltransferase [Pseudobdellovibrionaceae bacterium]
MNPSDLPEVAQLARQLGYPVDVREIENRFSLISDNSDYALFVAKTDENKAVGWIQINREPKSLLISDYADVAALVVDENYRGKGIGKLLLQEIEKWARQNKIKQIRLRSNSKRTDAHRFYLREGYQISKLANIFMKNCDCSITAGV